MRLFPFEIDTVASACQRFMTSYLTIQNCLSIRKFSQQHNLVELMNLVDQFTVDNFQVRVKNSLFTMNNTKTPEKN